MSFKQGRPDRNTTHHPTAHYPKRTNRNHSTKRLELAIESIILASRWLLVVFYLGLGVALAIYAL
ncbi:hypothetical protein ACFSQQ_23300 [Mesorhizobium kowhaii]|uniref:Uncharacterized protein n=1 Tax=Mesorhizobium kowhaii TaxID=1300272 RepID=A0A2W7E7X0_9HYPH|nr:hypothetical protein [Mesorhizobium kowhaii]PZV39276.1 hypothetical protein B5V02_04585 [Mesorhizobium kowhaii]